MIKALRIICVAGLIAVSACGEQSVTDSVAASLALPTPTYDLPRIAVVPENVNVCDDGVAKRKPDGSFVKWETRRKGVRKNESVAGKAVRQFRAIQFDEKGRQTRDVSCSLAVDEGATSFMRSYFKQSDSDKSDQPDVGSSLLASASSTSGGGQDCSAIDIATWFCSFSNGDYHVCFFDYAIGHQECFRFYAGSTPPTSPPNTGATGGHIVYTPPPAGAGSGGYYTYYAPGTHPNACPDTQEAPDPNDECVFTPPLPPPLTPAEQISNLVDLDPYALLDVPCGDISKWQALATMPFPLSVANRLLTDPVLSAGLGSWIQTLQSAKGPIVNMDYYAVTVPITSIPNNLSVNGYLNHVRTNINNYVDSPTQFNYYPGLIGEDQRWTGSSPLGTVFSITLQPGIEDGSVITTAYSSSRWTFSTVRTPEDWVHPVSGNREFGAVENGNGTATFYTKATDRISTLSLAFANALPLIDIFGSGGAVWDGFQNNLKAELGNLAVKEDSVVKRVDYVQLNKVLTGQADVSTLKCKQ